MTDENLLRLRGRLDALAQTSPDDGIEFWYARDLLKALGDNGHVAFIRHARRAAAACEKAGMKVASHCRSVLRALPGGPDGERLHRDFQLSRRACLLVVEAIDSRRNSVVFAREYFGATGAESAKADLYQENTHTAKAVEKQPPASAVEPIAAEPEAPAPSRAPGAPVALNPWQAALQRKQGNSGHGGRFIPGHGRGQLNPGGNPRLNKNLAYGRGYPNSAARNSR